MVYGIEKTLKNRLNKRVDGKRDLLSARLNNARHWSISSIL